MDSVQSWGRQKGLFPKKRRRRRRRVHQDLHLTWHPHTNTIMMVNKATKQISWEGFPYHPLSNQGNNINILASAIARAQTIHYLTGAYQTRQTSLSKLRHASSFTLHLLNNKYGLIFSWPISSICFDADLSCYTHSKPRPAKKLSLTRNWKETPNRTTGTLWSK